MFSDLTPEKKQELLNKIRELHKISVDDDDPLFALITANEYAFLDHMSKVDILFKDQLSNIEEATKRYQDEIKELAEVKISKAVNDAFNRLDAYKKEIDEALEYARSQSEITADQKIGFKNIPPLFWLLPIFSVALGYAAALFII